VSQTNVEVLKRDPEEIEKDRDLLHGDARTTAPGPAMCAPDASSVGAGNVSNGPMPRKPFRGSGRR
jgi:hypothetical protein